MPTAVPELIAAEIVARLQTITTGNGYAFTVTEVKRPSRLAAGWRARHKGIVVEQTDATLNEELSHPGNPPAMAYDLTFNIHGIVMESDESTSTGDTTANDMEASIKKSIAEDATWHNWDGNAVNSMWGQTSEIESIEMEGVTVPLVVTYRVSETDPYTVRA